MNGFPRVCNIHLQLIRVKQVYTTSLVIWVPYNNKIFLISSLCHYCHSAQVAISYNCQIHCCYYCFNKLLLLYLHLFLLLCSSFLYINLNFLPISFSFSLKNFFYYFMQGKFTSNKLSPVLFVWESHLSPSLLKELLSTSQGT